MIKDIGCTDDGGIWFSLLIEVDGVQQAAVFPMSQEKAERFHKYVGKALKMGKAWKKTGKRPLQAPIIGNGHREAAEDVGIKNSGERDKTPIQIQGGLANTG